MPDADVGVVTKEINDNFTSYLAAPAAEAAEKQNNISKAIHKFSSYQNNVVSPHLCSLSSHLTNFSVPLMTASKTVFAFVNMSVILFRESLLAPDERVSLTTNLSSTALTFSRS